MFKRIGAAVVGGMLLISAACSGGEKSTDESSDSGPARALFQPPGVVGPDSFAPSFDLATYEVTEEDETLSGTVDSSTPGLYRGRTYGGTGTNICDVEKMIEFLTYYEDRGRAWAEVQGIDFENLAEYMRALTPVFVTQDINVRMYGFKNGAAYGYDAIIGAGTALLIDDQGIPRARCACGHPLLPPTPEETPTTEPASTTVPGITTTETEPVCPELTIAGEWSDYVTTEGITWRYVAAIGQWMNVDDPAASLVDVLTDIPGYTEQCGTPEVVQQPCPVEVLGSSWTDANGDVWTWSSETAEGANWTRVDEGVLVQVSTADLPGVSSDCYQTRQRTPNDCPEEFQGARYVDAYGTEWVFTGSAWWANIDGQNVYLTSLELLGDDCADPVECPPYKARLGDDYVDPNGDRWNFDYHGNDRPGWDNLATDDVESLSNRELPQSEDCAPPTTTTEPPCPPTKARVGDTWVSTSGRTWVFGTDGGAAGWDDVSTDDIESLPTTLLPETDDCPIPVVATCPELDPVNGAGWLTPDGMIFIYSIDLAAWVSAADPNVTISNTALLPGYINECLPPCPPLQMSVDESGAWVDPATGDVWVWDGDMVAWVNLTGGATVASTVDLPWYRANCLPPCPPESETGEQESSWTTIDGSIVSSSAAERLRDANREPITITGGVPKIEPVDLGKLRSIVAVLDDCNEEGCLTPGVTPVEGHLFTDSRGIEWRLGGDGQWYSDDGVVAGSVNDIPGYSDICNPPSSPEDTPCPPEFEGSSYTDSNSDTWTWVGYNSDAADSDHGARWFRVDADGNKQYRTTAELEDDGRFADCAPPVETATGDLAVGVRAKGPVCAGISMYVVANVVPSDGATVASVTFEMNGTPFAATAASDTAFFTYVTSDEPGTFTVTVSATDSAGLSGTTSLDVTFSDCALPASAIDEPGVTGLSVRVWAKGPVCAGSPMAMFFTVIPSDGAAVNEVGADVDGTYFDVVTSNGSTWSGRINSTTPGTFTVTAGASDTNGAVGSSSIEVTFQECGQTSTSVARPTFTFVPSIPPVTFTPINPGSTTTTVARPVVTLTPSIPPVTLRPTTTTVARTTTTTTTAPSIVFTALAPSTTPNKVCVENLDTTGTGTLYVQTSVALSALTAKSGANNRATEKKAILRWAITVERADVGKVLNLTGTRAVGGSVSGTVTVPKGCGDI
ncbi:MAG: DUF6777 domain-containing protein [Acidimicrobiia bacterium]